MIDLSLPRHSSEREEQMPLLYDSVQFLVESRVADLAFTDLLGQI